MNRTNFEHIGFALLFWLPFALCEAPWVGAAFASGFFLGREHAQFEKKLVHGGDVGGLNPLSGFRFWLWSKDALLDLFPAVGAVILASYLWDMVGFSIRNLLWG